MCERTMRKVCDINMYTMIHCSFFIFFLGGLATISFYRNNSSQGVASNNFVVTPTNAGTCDLFSGRWVHDNKSHYPLYEEHECPYLDESYACQTYGRKDFKYLQWRWQPHDCDFPRFDGKAIVERLRGKRLMFVGDSLVRNQRNSMICMLYTSIPGVKRIGGELIGSLHTFRFTDYNISIDFYWAPMLVESNGDSPTDHLTPFRIVRIKSIEKHARHWVNSDILIFNSYRWWRSHVVNFLKSGGSLLDDPNNVYEEVNRVRAYKLGLKTWSNWAHTHIDPSKTKLFFMSATAVHVMATEWGGMSTMNCYGETEPVMDDRFRESQTDPKMLSILESSLNKLKAKGVNVQIINITQLTQCRKDAHPALYRKHWRPLTDEQKKNPQLASDCSHWCLPGVPDIWNELLLAYIFR
ncbi:putative PMR5 domain, PC-Esterase [Helianthus annuus]|nr:putative PMR5 domain, PC-Esterase [Helianthus annuus]KAJ0955474.1 putative PMR5 domain, PC-Esterase, trichome birefringence-like family [Helianthus annuus]